MTTCSPGMNPTSLLFIVHSSQVTSIIKTTGNKAASGEGVIIELVVPTRIMYGQHFLAVNEPHCLFDKHKLSGLPATLKEDPLNAGGLISRG